jgi:signal transduction histidine kinase
MKKFILLCILIFISCSETKKQIPKAVKGILDLSQTQENQIWDFQKDGILNLDGEWEFYPNEFLKPSEFLNQDKISTRTINYFKIPNKWNQYSILGKEMGSKGFGTFRLQILLPKMQDKENSTFSLKTSYINSAYELYANQRLIASIGKISKTEENSEIGYLIDVFHLNKEDFILLDEGKRKIDILVLVSNFHHKNGGFMRSLAFGDSKKLLLRDRWIFLFDFFLFGSIFIMGLYHLGLFYLRRNDKSVFWFGIFCLMICIRIPITAEHYIQKFGVNVSKYSMFIEYINLVLFVPIFSNFLFLIFPKEIRVKPKNLIVMIGYFLLLPILILPSFHFTKLLQPIQFYILFSGVYALYSLFKAVQKNRQEARTLLAGFIFFFIIIIHDILHTQMMIRSIPLFSLGLFVFIFSQAYLLSKRFSNAFKDSELQRNLLTEAKLEIENLSKTKDQFLANLSHEIKTPLSVVFAYSEMLPASKENPQKVEKYANQIFLNATKLNDYVSDLILMTDIESNLELQKSTIELKTILEESINSLKIYSEEKNIQWEIGEIPVILLFCDKLLLKKVFTVVLKNAIIYNQFSGKVKIETELNQKYVKVHITDTGIGIDNQQMERVFEKFFRADSSLTYEVSGVGIGLYLAKKILELHKGTINVQSEIDKGSRFTIQIPLEQK